MKKTHEGRVISLGRKRPTAVIILLAALVIAVAVWAAARMRRESSPESLSEFNNPKYTVGVVNGYIFGEAVERDLPLAQVRAFESREEAYRALYSGAVDGVADDEAIIRSILRSNELFVLLDGYLEPSEYAFVFPKTPEGGKLRDEFSAYVERLAASGGLSGLDAKWFGSETDNKTSEDAESLPAVNGTLTVAFDVSNIPFAYYSAGKPVGYDVDLAVGFCKENGYGLKFVRTEFSEMLQGVAESEYDAGCGAITVTEERKENLYFSTPDYSGGISVCTAVPAETVRKRSYLSDVRRSFGRTFAEGRLSRFFAGIGVTLLIVLTAVVFGTPFGVILYISGLRAPFPVRVFTRFIVRLLHGLPAVMIILLLYYRYYRNLYMGGIPACAIGIMLVLAAEICRILDRAALDLDNRISETGYRLEFLDSKEYFGELFDGCGDVIVREYGDCAGLMAKASAVAGFAGVRDMTKTFDLIRLESLEIGVPLIMTAVVYYILITLLTWLAGKAAAFIARKISGWNTEK